MRLSDGGLRELHWHSVAEWAFILYGNTRITCIDADGKSFVTDLKEGDPWHTDGRLEVAVLAVLSFSPTEATNNPAKP